VEEKEEIDYGNETVTQEKLGEFWSKYVENIQSNSGGFTASVISTCQPQLQEDQTTIHTIFRTETNQIEFIRLSEDLLKYLKANLRNNHLKFTWEINQEKAKKILFTDREKFDYLIEKHPQLKDWENKLGLEFR
jgi:DNA polymerase-3 subunit gamma/tau